MNDQVAYFIELIKIYKDLIDENEDNYFYSNKANSEREKLLGLYLNNEKAINHILDGIDIDYIKVGSDKIQIVPTALSDDIKKAQFFLDKIVEKFSRSDPEHDSNFMTLFEGDFKKFINTVLTMEVGEKWCMDNSVLNGKLKKKGLSNRKKHNKKLVIENCIEVLDGLTLSDFQEILMNNFKIFHKYLGLSTNKSEKQKLNQWFIALSRYRNSIIHTGMSPSGVYELESRAALHRFLSAFNMV